MPLSIEDARVRLAHASELLSQPLKQMLEQFKPDKDMQEMFENYLPVWGDRSLHDFMEGVISCGHADEPDIWNMEMEPFNLLLALDIFYRS